MKTIKHSFTIDRSLWRTGGEDDNKTGEGVTMLQNQKGYMCCLGFLADSLGLKTKKKKEPEDLTDKEYLIFDGILPYSESQDAMRANDDEMTCPSKKEKIIAGIFQKRRVKVEFVGEYNSK